MTFVPIGDAEMAGLRLLAKGRHLPKERAEVVSRHMTGDGLEVHVQGLLGEYAVAKALNILLDIALHLCGDDKRDLHLPDGRSLQVKYRSRKGFDFALLSTDPREFAADIGVLVWPAVGGCDIVGCISRAKFLRVARIADYGHGERLVASAGYFTPLEVALGIPA